MQVPFGDGDIFIWDEWYRQARCGYKGWKGYMVSVERRHFRSCLCKWERVQLRAMTRARPEVQRGRGEGWEGWSGKSHSTPALGDGYNCKKLGRPGLCEEPTMAGGWGVNRGSLGVTGVSGKRRGRPGEGGSAFETPQYLGTLDCIVGRGQRRAEMQALPPGFHKRRQHPACASTKRELGGTSSGEGATRTARTEPFASARAAHGG